jgi:uncharacterized membrane protein
MAIGPIQIIAFKFGADAEFRGEILAELENLRGQGLIRVVDLLFVRHEGDSLLELQYDNLSEDERVEFGVVIGALLGYGAGGEEGAIVGAVEGALAADESILGMSADDVRDIADRLEPGESAAILLFEHTWAIPLRDAIRRTGGQPVAQAFLTPEAVMLVGAELQAMVEAEEAIEMAEAVKAMALLEAVEAVVASEMIQEQAAIEAVEAIETAEAIKALAAAEAVRALIASDIIQEMAAEEALDALVTAGLIEEAVLSEAEARTALTDTSDA